MKHCYYTVVLVFMKDLVYMDAKNSDRIYFISTSLLPKIDKKKKHLIHKL